VIAVACLSRRLKIESEMIRKKFMIVGLILLFSGTAMLGWTLTEKRKQQRRMASYKLKYSSETNDYLKQYNEWLQLPPQERSELPLVLDENGRTKTKAQLRQEQAERLKADLDKLAAGETVLYPLADILYGENWQDELDKYKKQKERGELVLTGSIVCASMGGSIFAWCLLLWTAHMAVRGLSGLSKFSAGVRRNLRKGKDQKLSSADEKDSEQQQPPREDHTQFETHSTVLMNKGWPNPAPFKYSPTATQKMAQKQRIPKRAEKIAVLLSDEKSVGPHICTESARVGLDTSEYSKPLDNTLEELTEQVSAIRQYTAFQQNRLEKLQDGYDWNIIRTFCLRVIRCIDNIESRIDALLEQGLKTTHLEEVRDELIFALESSGVEQFEPEIDSDYRGQERYAEAVKGKQRGNSPKQTGKIAKVIRPGYQYFIDEENIKVVRPAQVRLFA